MKFVHPWLKLAKRAVRVAVHQLRARYRKLLRDEVRQAISDPAQVEEEMRILFSAFAQ
jgi:RNA polymerase sigma-70 factor (ECF subfamily)